MKNIITLFVMLVFLLCAAGAQAATQDSFFRLDHATKSGSGLSAPDGVKLPVNKNEYANFFYKNCVASGGQVAASGQYIQSTCACAAAALPDILTLGQMAAVFKSSSDDIDLDLYTRFMYLGYIPCMANTMKEYVHDTCLEDPSVRRLVFREKICACMGEKVSGFFEKYGFYLVPGIQNYSGMMRLAPEKTPADLMSHFLLSDQGKAQTENQSEVCIAREAYGR